jgi:lysylphosphatidylglycerol synthase-like protein
MDGSIETLVAFISTAGEFLAHVFRRFDIPLLALGLILHLVADVVRNRGWYGVLRAVGPEHDALRVRDVQAAAFAGGGVNAIVPARAGDLVKAGLLRRRVPDAPMPTLMATLLPETLFEWIAGATLLTWALAQGYLPVRAVAGRLADLGGHTVTAIAAAVAVAALAALVVTMVRRHGGRFARNLADGIAILREPRTFVTQVVTWQLGGRVIRLVAMCCCLSACRLPGAPAAAAVAMAIDGGTRLHFAPATTGIRVGLLAYALPAATGTAVSLGAVIGYLMVVKTARMITATVIGGTVLVVSLGARSPRRALAAIRALRAGATVPVEAPPAEAPVVAP